MFSDEKKIKINVDEDSEDSLDDNMNAEHRTRTSTNNNNTTMPKSSRTPSPNHLVDPTGEVTKSPAPVPSPRIQVSWTHVCRPLFMYRQDLKG